MAKEHSRKTKALEPSGCFSEMIEEQFFDFYKTWFANDYPKLLPFSIPDPRYADVEIEDNFTQMMDEIFLCLNLFPHNEEVGKLGGWPPDHVKAELEKLQSALDGLKQDAFVMLPADAKQWVNKLKDSVSQGLVILDLRPPKKRGQAAKTAFADVEFIAAMAGIYERFFKIEPTPDQAQFVKFLQFVCDGCSSKVDFEYTTNNRKQGIEKYLRSKK